MGLMVKQKDKDWIIEVSEEWYFEKRDDFDRFVDVCVKEKTSFKVVLLQLENGFLVNINCVFRKKNPEELMVLFVDLFDFKKRFGDVAEKRGVLLA